MNDSLAAVLPPPHTCEVAGETVDVSQLKLGELAALQPLLKQLQVPWLENGDPDLLGLLAGEQVGVVLDALAVAVRRPRHWIDGLDVEQALQLATAVIDVNADFFARRVIPMLESGAARLRERLGPTSFSGSSALGMGSTPSAATP